MTTGVVTPKGHVGSHVLRLLVQAGERPRALTRDPAGLDAEVARHVDAAVLDVWDEASVVEATRGLRAVYWVSPTAPGGDPVEAHARAARNIRAAIEANGIERVVFQSSVGAERRHGVGEIDGLAATEVALDGSAGPVAVAHLRCGYLFTNLLMDFESLRSGVLTTAMDLDRPQPWVAPEDVAAVAAVRLLSRGWTGRHVQAVHGPEDLSFRQVAERLAHILGHPVQAQQVTDDEVRAELTGFGLPEAQVESIVGMTIGIRDGFTPENPRSYVTTTPTTLEGWAAANLPGA